jgi:membrane-associated phospholipid phosphatase
VQREHRKPLLSLEEALTLGMAVLYALAALLFAGGGKAAGIIALNCLITGVVLAAAAVYRRHPSGRLAFFRDWYVVAFLIAVYLENRTLIPLVNPNEYDALVMALDRHLFMGHDPAALLECIMHPLLTEVLQLVYASFYFLPLSLCVMLYLRDSREEFHLAASTILMGFYLSYLGYYVMPVAGPRFFMEQGRELEGLLTFGFVRQTLASLEGRMLDCMPSGHALVSVLTTLLAFRHARSFAPVALCWTAALIFSTVYLRYHYVLDLLAGFVLAFAVFCVGPAIVRLFTYGPEGACGLVAGSPPGEG